LDSTASLIPEDGLKVFYGFLAFGFAIFGLLVSATTARAQDAGTRTIGALWQQTILSAQAACDRASQELYSRAGEEKLTFVQVLLEPDTFVAKCTDQKTGRIIDAKFKAYGDLYVRLDEPRHPAMMEINKDPRDHAVAAKICRDIDVNYIAAETIESQNFYDITCERLPKPGDRGSWVYYFTQKVRYAP
jgi:hypothetical protein